MFQELLPILANRTVLITLAKTSENLLTLNLVPQAVGKDDNKTLLTPLTITGTPQELDEELGHTLAGYTDAIVTAANNLAQIEAEMQEAIANAKKNAGEKVEVAKKDATKEATSKAKAAAKAAPKPAAEKPAAPKTDLFAGSLPPAPEPPETAPEPEAVVETPSTVEAPVEESNTLDVYLKQAGKGDAPVIRAVVAKAPAETPAKPVDTGDLDKALAAVLAEGDLDAARAAVANAPAPAPVLVPEVKADIEADVETSDDSDVDDDECPF